MRSWVEGAISFNSLLSVINVNGAITIVGVFGISANTTLEAVSMLVDGHLIPGAGILVKFEVVLGLSIVARGNSTNLLTEFVGFIGNFVEERHSLIEVLIQELWNKGGRGGGDKC